MIFGYLFTFKDEPVLQEWYSSYFAEEKDHYNREIEVVLYEKHDLLDICSFASNWISLSGQLVRYKSRETIAETEELFSWALEIQDILTLVWDAKEKQILFLKGKYYTAERLRFWLFHTFFPMVLELEQIYSILHVGSVEIKGRPLIFSALSFGGKSTMTNYFIQKGHTMLSDDTLAIDKRGEEYYAIASYPFHRPYREPEVLGYPVENFATAPKPLYAVYLLEKSEPDAVVKIEEVKGIEKFKAFHYSTFINFSFMKKRRFTFFTEMAKYVPVYRVIVPWNMERIDEVYDAIVQKVQEL